MITEIRSTTTSTEAGHKEFLGLSTDSKPTGVPVNSVFFELNTGDMYYFNGSTWAKIGG
ncbi:MAG: hypothetical protein IKF99_10385 [Oscillospiraceae bacterium]|nr:hypothetical protein [Oscillospiraceae bacterium]